MGKKNSKNTIMDCALELFCEHGYEGVSPNDIVEKAGVKKPTLYYFFGNKEGLLREILETNYTKLNDLIETNSVYKPNPENYEKDIFPVLYKLLNAIFDFTKENSKFYLMVLSMSFLPPSSKTAQVSAPYHVTHYLLVESMFQQIAQVHSNLKGKEGILAMQFLAFANANIGFWYRGYTKLNKNVAHNLVHQFLHGIFV